MVGGDVAAGAGSSDDGEVSDDGGGGGAEEAGLDDGGAGDRGMLELDGDLVRPTPPRRTMLLFDF